MRSLARAVDRAHRALRARSVWRTSSLRGGLLQPGEPARRRRRRELRRSAELLDADDAVQTAIVAPRCCCSSSWRSSFIVWQFRHAKNARALGERGGLGPGWAIGGWFVPLANFVLPGVQIHQSSRMSDSAAAGEPDAKGKGAADRHRLGGAARLGALLFVVAAGACARPTTRATSRSTASTTSRPPPAATALPAVGMVAVRRRGDRRRGDGVQPLDQAGDAPTSAGSRRRPPSRRPRAPSRRPRPTAAAPPAPPTVARTAAALEPPPPAASPRPGRRRRGPVRPDDPVGHARRPDRRR